MLGTKTPSTSLTVLVLPSMDLTPALARTQSQGETVLKVKFFKEASLMESKGAFVSWCKTRERFHEGMPLLPLALSLGKPLLTFMGELPSLSAMADL